MSPTGPVATKAEGIRSAPGAAMTRRPDVDARLDLMRALRDTIAVGALGTRPALRDKFTAAGFEYGSYIMSRRVNPVLDRKSTRLNSSHMSISYAVFCLKKKKNTKTHTTHKNQKKKKSRK